ncbi:hypothetical protein NC652_012519 [Populus alba x Populus x berolinensis]|nr:hypothetical protein NC652_012519 [Populus alba x Populus x berolinensis]
MMEKRQLFLRSYQFCRKRTLRERIKGFFDKSEESDVAETKICS